MKAVWLQRMAPHGAWFRVMLGLLALAGALALIGPGVAYAEGTVDLYDGYTSTYPRGLIEWRNNVYGKDNITGPNGYDVSSDTQVDGMAYRRTFFRVYANQGERILVGSSAMYNDMTDITTSGQPCYNLPGGGDCLSDIVIWTQSQIEGLTGQSYATPDALPTTPAFSCRTNSTGTTASRSRSRNSTRRISGSTFMPARRNAGMSAARTGP